MGTDFFVYDVGTQVLLAPGVEGKITAVCIRGKRYVSYEVAWFNNGERREAWVHETDVVPLYQDQVGLKAHSPCPDPLP